MTKQQALKKLIGRRTIKTNFGTYECELGEWLVLTEQEADKEAKERILDSAWAFKSLFILNHLKKGIELETEHIDKIKKLYESGNDIILALVNKKEFIEDAIKTDGRGHFLASYDGDEEEVDGYYIYRTN